VLSFYVMMHFFNQRIYFVLLTLVILVGCQSSSVDIHNGDSPQERLAQMLRSLPTVKSVELWQTPSMIQQASGASLKIVTGHYEIYTTLTDRLILRQVPVFLESAFGSYCQVIDKPVKTDKLMKVYFFDTRQQWEDFTGVWAGQQGQNYLKIRSGAYYLRGACVAYRLSRKVNFSVLAHEGWHQFCDEMFRFRLPAWLDEGLATNFEANQWQKGKFKFDPRRNGSRLWSLRQTIASGKMFSISELLRLDAGRIISHSTYNNDNKKIDPKVAAYYAQIYALVRFLREYNYCQHLLDFQKMLGDSYSALWPLSQGQKDQAIQREHNPTRRWNSQVGPLIFTTYIAPMPAEIEAEYHAFCLKIISDVKFKKGL